MFVPSISGSQPSPQARRPSRQQMPPNSQQQRPQFADVYQSVASAPPRASDDQSRIPLPRYAPNSSSIPSLASVVNSHSQFEASRTHLDGHAGLRSGGNGFRGASLIGRTGGPHSQAELSEAMAAYAAAGAEPSLSSNASFRGSIGAKGSGSDTRKQASASARAIAEHNQRISQSLQSYSQPSTAQYTGQNSGRSVSSVDSGWTNPSSSRTSLSAMSTPSMLSPSSSAPSSGRYSTQSGFSAPYQNPHSTSAGNAPRALYAPRDLNERMSGSWTSMDASAPKSAPAAGGQGVLMHGSEDKLASAQRVIRKLYRKSIELSSSVAQIFERQLASRDAPAQSVSISSPSTQRSSSANGIHSVVTSSRNGGAPSAMYASEEEEAAANRASKLQTADQVEEDEVIQQSIINISPEDDDADIESAPANFATDSHAKDGQRANSAAPRLFGEASESPPLFGASAKISEQQFRLHIDSGNHSPIPASDVRSVVGSPLHGMNSRPSTSTSWSASGNGGKAPDRRHLIFLIEQKERIISKLQGQLEKYVRRVADLERESRATPFVSRQEVPAKGPVAFGSPGPVDSSSSPPQFQRYKTLRREHHLRLVDRLQALSSLLVSTSATTATSSIGQSRGSGGSIASAGSALSMQVLADLPREVAPLIAEQQRLLADESINRQMIEMACSAKIFAAEQRQAQWYVDRKLLEAEQVDLKQQLHQRDELDRHIEARVLTMMDRLREVESENVQLKFSMQQQAAAFAAKIATATAVTSATDTAASASDAASPTSASAPAPV